MRSVIGGLCTFIIGLEVLVGVPLAVCFAFFCSLEAGSMFPMNVEFHAGPRLHATVPPADFLSAPPPNIIPSSTEPCSVPPPNCLQSENPILQTRQDTGSPLAGTVLADDAQEEQQLFLTALEKAAEDAAAASCQASACPLEVAHPVVNDTEAQLIAHLYQMAQLDEDAGHFDRADQWRAQARELRRESIAVAQ